MKAQSRCDIAFRGILVLCPCACGLEQYGHVNNSCPFCFLFCFVLYFKIDKMDTAAAVFMG